MWCPKWGNLSIRPNIGVVDDDIESRGFDQPHILRPLTIPQVAEEEVVVLEFEKDGRVRGGKREKHRES
jgi:hypothetical protein